MKNIKTLIFSLILIMVTNTAPAQTIGNYANVNGLKMYYEIHGTGEPLVLLHGGGSTIYTTFGRILPELAKTHKVIAVELQAHGHTGDRDAPESFEQDANDVATLLKQLNIAKADIFGFSNGGQTAIQIGIKHPDVVRKLIIASAFYRRDGVAFDGFWGGFDHATLNNMPQVYQDEYLKITNSHERLLNMFNKDVQRMKGFKDWTDEDIKSIQAPALVVSGDHDVATAEHTVKMYRLLPHGRLAMLPGTHGSYMGEIMSPDPNSKVHELFVAMINEFLAEPVVEGK
ncbi:MAG TPA: alpha/beta hydrolase [Mucilaginibacter sp.]|jgi:pimeloyl-ACP methyl ester carboxylesterase